MNKFFTLLLVCFCSLFGPFHATAQFTSLETIAPLPARDFATREKPQAKIIHLDDQYWAILANESGTHLWRLDNNTWQHELELVTKNARADYVVLGNTVHMLLYSGPASQFVSVEYDRESKKFKPWESNAATVAIALESEVEVASIDADKSGRLWIASNGGNGTINMRWSDAPYTTWSAPVTIAQNLHQDDICAVISLPQANKIGVMWSNQNTKRWGFKTHTLGDEVTKWSQDEVPAAKSALSQGTGMADDHINMKVASDGTLYAAIKTGYDKTGYPLIALLVRRPAGVWDELYEVSQTGTLPIVVLNEEQNMLKVVYSSATYGGDILYKETSLSDISFCAPHVLISGVYNYASSTKRGYTGQTVILASNETQVVGVVATDNASLREPISKSCFTHEVEASLLAFPNPFNLQTTISFRLPEDPEYALTLYDSSGEKVTSFQHMAGTAGQLNSITLDAATLSKGLYILKLTTKNKVRAIKIVHER